MENNFDPNSLQQAMRMANTPAGKQLMGLLQQADPAAMQQAIKQASAGDFSQVAKTLAPLMASEDIRSLLKQMGG